MGESATALKEKENKGKKEAKLASIMFTQELNREFFNTVHNGMEQFVDGEPVRLFYWEDYMLDAVEAGDIRFIVDFVRYCLCSSIINTGVYYNDNVVKNIYGVIHDSDTRIVWDDKLKEYVSEDKHKHFHIVVEFEIKMSLSEVSRKLNVNPEYIEKPKSGRFGLNNFLAYLIHAKDLDKFQYPVTSVVSSSKNSTSYSEVYKINCLLWEKGAAKKTKARAVDDVDYIIQRILKGELTKEQILLTDEYYTIYTMNSRKINEAFDIYTERKLLLAVRDMDRGAFKTSIFFITGDPGSGKSHFTNLFASSLISAVKEREGEVWGSYTAAATNSLDDYMGEEILIMDDLRGASMTASDWLKLLNGDTSSSISARYHNKTVAPRCIIINSVKNVLDFFYYAREIGGGDRSEPMDQFLRRILALVTVYYVPDEFEPDNLLKGSRFHSIGVRRRLQKAITEYVGDNDRVKVNYDFDTDYNNLDLSSLGMYEALEFLINTVWYNSFGSIHTIDEVEAVADTDNFIKDSKIQTVHCETDDIRACEEAELDEALDNILDILNDEKWATSDSDKQKEIEDTIVGLKNGDLFVASENGKFKIVSSKGD